MKHPSPLGRTLLGFFVLAPAIQLAALSQTNCLFTDIGSVDGTLPVHANGISLTGATIVGSVPTADGVTHAFMWQTNIMTVLPSLGGSNSVATAINRSGTVAVGSSYTTNGYNHAVAWTLYNGQIFDLGTLGGTNSVATALNEDIIVGYSQNAIGWTDAWSTPISSLGNGALTVLPPLVPSPTSAASDGGYTIATGVNYSSPPEICGQSLWINHDWHGYPGPNFPLVVWSGGNIVYTGTGSGPDSYAAGVNDNGVLCGTTSIGWQYGGNSEGFVNGGLWIPIGDNHTPPLYVPKAINNSNVICGYAGGSAFIRDSGTVYDLTPLVQGIPTTLTSANAINNYGQMAANGADGHAYLLSPVEQPVIYQQPQSQIVGFGTNVTFSVRAVGFPSLSYQWNFNGTNILGANSSSLTLTNLVAANAGSYTVTVSDPAGSTNSTVATLGLVPSLAISLVPGLTIVGNPGDNYDIQYVNSVGAGTDWITLANVTLVSSQLNWSDFTAIGQPTRLYRAVLK